MRTFARLLVTVLSLAAYVAGSGDLLAQSCTGLCLQQVSCAGGKTTSITGVVYAPNGIDPLPHVQVYIPNAPVAPFTPGVSCPIEGATPSGSPLVGTISSVDGSFTLDNVPVGQNIPLVIVTGRWRRQLVIPSTAECANTNLAIDFAVMPQDRTQGDIPKIAIATGAEDAIECTFTDIGINPSEITDPSGGGRINLFGGGGMAGSGVVVDTATPTQASLMGDASTLNQYDVLMLPSEGADYTKPQPELTNLVDYANAGGRVFTTHYSYSWMWQNPPFDGVARWSGGPGTQVIAPDEDAGTIDTDFPDGDTLAQWLHLVGASTIVGQIPVVNPFRDTIGPHGVIAPTQEWLYVSYPERIGPVPPPIRILTVTGQFIFDTPITPSGSGANQCGRVLYDDYDIEAPSTPTTGSTTYPNECPDRANSPVSPQQKLLEFNLFELTDTGGLPTIFPSSYDFGSQAVGYPATPESFTWTNNSNIPMTVSSASVTGTDFTLIAGTDTCTGVAVAAHASCTLSVGFTPSEIGPRAGTLSVFSGVFSVAAVLNGNGSPTFTLTPATLTFGGIAVGTSSTLQATLTSNATNPLPLPSLTTTAGYTASTAGCPNPVPPMGVCTVNVTFSPTTIASVSGPESGTLEAGIEPEPERTLLYGYGIADLTLTPSALDFGSQAIGSSTTLNLTLKSLANRALATPVFTLTGSYYNLSTAACGNALQPGASCQVAVTFNPQDAGVFAGTLADNSTDLAYAGLTAALTGIAGDFSLALNPNSGSVIAGEGKTLNAVVTELAGRDTGLVMTCTLAAPATACSVSSPTYTATTATYAVNVSTTSEYLVIGYTGFGGNGNRGAWLLALASGGLLWIARRRASHNAGWLLRVSLSLLALAIISVSVTGCSGLLPAKNASYTPPGTYVVTVTATDGLLSHSATYSLTVNAK